MKIDVIICTKNPKSHYFEAVLEALRNQSLSREFWDLYIVDNGSTPPVKECLPAKYDQLITKIFVEDKPGLTHARLVGIQNTQEELIVFVDDDNVLDENYLEKALEIGTKWTCLGTWGGQISGTFEQEPPQWSKRYLNWLAVRVFDTDLWSNLPFNSTSHPYGAGMCIRRCVAQAYLKLVNLDHRHLGLDRKGNRLWGGGDADIAYTCSSLGLGNGIFTSLHLTHLMPLTRLEEGYLLKLVEDMTCSHHILNFLWGIPVPFPSRSQRLLTWYQCLFLDARDRRFEVARQKGLKQAQQLTFQLKSEQGYS